MQVFYACEGTVSLYLFTYSANSTCYLYLFTDAPMYVKLRKDLKLGRFNESLKVTETVSKSADFMAMQAAKTKVSLLSEYFFNIRFEESFPHDQTERYKSIAFSSVVHNFISTVINTNRVKN